MKKTLYEITDAMREKLDRIDTFLDPETGEVTDQAGLDDLIVSITDDQEDFRQKACDIAAYIQELKALASGMAEAAKSINARRAAIERKTERLADYLLFQMQKAGSKKIEGTQVRVSVAKKPDSVNIVNEADIPEAYWKPQPPVLNKMAIKEALKKGEAVPGAAMNEAAFALRIK